MVDTYQYIGPYSANAFALHAHPDLGVVHQHDGGALPHSHEPGHHLLDPKYNRPDPTDQEPDMSTADEIAEARSEVEKLESVVTNTRYQLSYAVGDEDAEIDRLAVELADALDQLRRARTTLTDMEAGAGDFHDGDADDGADRQGCWDTPD